MITCSSDIQALRRPAPGTQVAKHLGIPSNLSPELIAGLNEHVAPHADEWRQFGVFPRAIEPPADADDETRPLSTLGFWVP